jgi:hypothetical protein
MKSRLVFTLLLLITLIGSLATPLAAQRPEDVETAPVKPAAEAPAEAALVAPDSGIQSLSGSYVEFDPSLGGDTCYLPGNTQTFCFRAESFTNDWEYVYNLWEKFPGDWTVNNVYVQGTPVCDSGGTWGTFGWSFQTPPYEVNIAHGRYHANPSDHCTAYYCFEVVAGTGVPDALESWYWSGDGYGNAPHHPCSDDNYAPAGQAACDEAIQPQAAIPPCVLDPIMLTPMEIEDQGCPCELQEHELTVWNNTGYDTDVNLTYALIQGDGTCEGPPSVFVPNDTTVPIIVNLDPVGEPDDVVVCEIYAEDAANPDNNDTSWIYKTLIAEGFDPAGWQLENIAGALSTQWGAGAVGTNPAAAGDVGYYMGGLAPASVLRPALQMYDPGTDTWTQLANMINPRFSPVAGWIDGLLYAGGGFDAAFIATNDLQVYNPATDTWDDTTYPDMPAARGGGSGGVGTCASGSGECLFHVGGGPDSQFANTTLETWQYDPGAMAWTQLDNKPAGSSPDGLTLGGGVACMGQVYVGGDYRGFHEFYRLDATQPSGSQWTQLANIPSGGGAMTPAMVCKEDWGKIVLIGGDSIGYWGDLYNNRVYVYDIATDTWEGPLDQTLNVGLLGSIGLHMYDKVWTFGGTNGSGPTEPVPHESLMQITCEPCPGGECTWTELVAEDFEAWPPADWTIVNYGGDCIWESTATTGRPNYAGGDGQAADADSDWCGSGTIMDTGLQTPLLDLSNALTATLQYVASYYDIGSGDYAAVNFNESGMWSNLLTWDENHDDHGPGELVTLDLPVGDPEAFAEFYYYAPDWDWWYQVDQVVISACLTTQPPPISAAKEAPLFATQGEVISYTIFVEGDDLGGAYMLDPLPAGVEYADNLSWNIGYAYYSPTVNTVFWEYNDKAPNAPAPAPRVDVAPLALPEGAGPTTASPQVQPVAVPAASPEDVLWDQPLSVVNQGAYVNQDFPDVPDYSAFLADDFVNDLAWEIQSIFVPGDGWNGFTTIMNATALTWQIYADNAGVPDGDPSGGGNAPFWTLTLPPTDPHVVVSNGTPGGYPSNVQLSLDPSVILPEGHWWLVFYPTMEFGLYGQYGRQPADTTNGYIGQFINPGGGFGLGTEWQNWTVLGATQQDIAFRIEGVPTQGPQQAIISFDVTVTGNVGDIIVNEGMAGLGDFVVGFAASTEIIGGAPDIVVDPMALSAELCPDETDTVDLSICNEGDADLEWSLREMTRSLGLGNAPLGPTDIGFAQDIGYISDNFVTFVLNDFPGQTILGQQTRPIYGMDFDSTATILYALDGDSNEFGVIDTANGAWTTIGPSTPSLGNWTGLTIDANDVIYASSTDCATSFALHTIDPATGVATLIATSPDITCLIDIAINADGEMYGHDLVTDAIYQIDPATAAATYIGPTGYLANYAQGMDFDADDGTLYIFLYQGSGNNVYGTVNLATGAVTPLAINNPLGEFEGAIAVPFQAVDVPWLSEDPTEGTLLPGECMTVGVTFDSTMMDPGEYLASLLILSNDPDTPEVEVPVTMTVLAPAEIVDVTYTAVGLEVAFDSTVAGSEPISYLWDFGDGETSADPDPTHVYTEAGCYLVTLTASNACTIDEWSEEICVAPLCEPVAGVDFSWAPEVGIVGEDVLFTAMEPITGTAPFTYTWDFGDDGTGMGITVTHVYAAADVYTVTLTVENECGMATAVHEVMVETGIMEIYVPVVLRNS